MPGTAASAYLLVLTLSALRIVLRVWVRLDHRAPVLRGRDADLLLEKTGEIRLRGEAQFGRYFVDLGTARGELGDRRFDAQHVEVGARRAPGAELEQVVEARARQADLARELVHVHFLVRVRAQQRQRLADAVVGERRAAPEAGAGLPPR